MTADLSARDILDILVSFPTVSTESNLELVDWVANFLSSHSIESHRDVSACGRKASLFAQIGPLRSGRRRAFGPQ